MEIQYLDSFYQDLAKQLRWLQSIERRKQLGTDLKHFKENVLVFPNLGQEVNKKHNRRFVVLSYSRLIVYYRVIDDKLIRVERLVKTKL